MPRFFRRLAEGVFDHEDVARRSTELARWINAAISHYAIERDGLTLVGFSNGANIAAAMMLLRPEGSESLRSAILIRAMIPVPAQTSATPALASALESASAPAATHARVLVLAGARDPIVPASNSAELAAMLRGRGIETSLEMLNAGHEITREDVTLARTWLGVGAANQTPGA
jgi:phospholipase/carboxylesterase